MDAQLKTQNSSPKTPDQLHQHVLMLWGRYTDLIRDVLVLQGRLSDLVKEAQAAGQRIYELYGKTDDRLDEPPSDRSDESDRSD